MRNREQDWFETDEWIRLGLLHAFGEHLAWVRIIERRFGFLPFEAARRDRVFTDHLARRLLQHAVHARRRTPALASPSEA